MDFPTARRQTAALNPPPKRDNSTHVGDKDAARAKVRDLMKDYNKSLGSILTKEQKKQYMSLVKAAREKAKAARDGASKPNG